MGRHRRRLVSAFTSASLARARFESVFRRIQNRPLLEVAQMCVNPRNVNVSGFPSPRAARSRAARRPNPASRVLPGCSSSPNRANLPPSSTRNRSASYARGAVAVDERLRTTNPRVWAAGDVTGAPQFVYVSAYQGALAAGNALLGEGVEADLTGLPRVIFTSPPPPVPGSPRPRPARPTTRSPPRSCPPPRCPGRWSTTTPPG